MDKSKSSEITAEAFRKWANDFREQERRAMPRVTIQAVKMLFWHQGWFMGGKQGAVSLYSMGTLAIWGPMERVVGAA